jgi:hypothetical protein
VVQSGHRLCLLPSCTFSWVEETHLSLQRKPSMLEAAAFSIFFPVRIELVFERNASWKPLFSQWRKAHFVPNRPIHPSGRNTCVSQRNPPILYAGASRIFIPCEYWVSFWMQCFLQLRSFKMDFVSLCSKYAFAAVLKNTCVSPK